VFNYSNNYLIIYILAIITTTTTNTRSLLRDMSYCAAHIRVRGIWASILFERL